MKKYILKWCWLLLPQLLLAQRYNNEPFDLAHKKFTTDAGMLSLVSDKNLLELGEIATLTVRINWPVDADSPVPQQYDYRFQDPGKSPWKITKWEILDGGGELVVGNDNYYAIYHSSRSMPVNRYATIAVTLLPQDPTKPKVQLLQTIYLADNDNVFYFDCPYLGITAEKYVIKNNGGAMANSDASAQKATNDKIAAAKQQAMRYYLQGAAAEVASTQAGFDLASLSSNAKAIYNKEEDVTTIIINDDKVEMVSGQKTTKKRMYNIVLSFPGKAAGSFKIKSNKKIAAAITLPQIYPGYACTCEDDPTDPSYFTDDPPPHPACGGGTITITRYDGKTVEGYVNAMQESANPFTAEKFFSTLNGIFKVPLANQ